MDSGPIMYIQGASRLFEEVGSDDQDVTFEALRTLLHMIEEKTRLVRLLEECISGSGLTVVIGSEHHAPDLQSFSVVASTYSDGRASGTVGVIGPTRMHYSRAINAVDSFSRAISRMVSTRS
jgi:heat-inducible transcriptional repressor